MSPTKIEAALLLQSRLLQNLYHLYFTRFEDPQSAFDSWRENLNVRVSQLPASNPDVLTSAMSQFNQLADEINQGISRSIEREHAAHDDLTDQ
jgi:hypothetical protein